MTWKRHLCACLVLSAVAFTAGCATYRAPVIPPKGWIFTNVKHPLTADYNASPAGNQLRVSSRHTQFFWDWLLTGIKIGWDEADIDSIARRGGISEVSYAEVEVTEILGFYAKFEVSVYGN